MSVKRYEFTSWSTGKAVAVFGDDHLITIEGDGIGQGFLSTWRGVSKNLFSKIYNDLRLIPEDPFDVLLRELARFRETHATLRDQYENKQLRDLTEGQLALRRLEQGRLFAVDEIEAIINRIRPR